MTPYVADLIRLLALRPHVEGGWYCETYRSPETVAAAALPARCGGARPLATSILFLLAAGEVARLHRLAADEMWYWHAGGALTLHLLGADGDRRDVRLGGDPAAGEAFQAVVPAGTWFGARPAAGAPYALVGCALAPGFDAADFELGERARLLATFPDHADLIAALT